MDGIEKALENLSDEAKELLKTFENQWDKGMNVIDPPPTPWTK